MPLDNQTKTISFTYIESNSWPENRQKTILTVIFCYKYLYHVWANSFKSFLLVQNLHERYFLLIQHYLHDLYSRRPGFNPRSHHTKDFKNGT